MPTRSNIFITTKDSVHIVGTLVLPDDTPRACALLLHMMPSTRKSFSTLQEALAERNITSLAIDLRGHGESVNQRNKMLDYKKFTDAEHQQSIYDVDEAFKYLLAFTGFPEKKSVLVGASIGANLALRYHAEHQDIALTVALSPGFSYRGIEIASLALPAKFPSRVVLATSQGDEYSFETVKKMDASPSDAIVSRILEGSEHGTNMFLNPDFFNDIVDVIGSVT